jgi:hypothetical protein
MPKKQQQQDITIKRFDMYLPVRLSPDELRERGEALAHHRGLAERHNAQAAEVKAELKKRAESIESEISRLAAVIRGKAEARPVVVEVRLTKKPGWVEEVRIDTGEVIASRHGTPEELQTDMLDVPFDAIPMPGELEA